MKFLVFLGLFFLSHVLADNPSPIADDGHCIWYEACDENPDKPGLYLNCQYDGEAKELTENIDLLQTSCPELMDEVTDEDGKVFTCCGPENLSIMSSQLVMLEGILNRCPSCLSNLRKSFCYFACHPRHSKFVIATSFYDGDFDDKSVYTVTEYITDTYVNDTYDSCENVYYPGLNDVALSILCGPYGKEDCSPHNLFNYFGINSFAPFNITYIYTEDNVELTDLGTGEQKTMEPFNPVTIPCNTNETSMHCLCSDCAQSCPAPPEPDPPPSHIYVGNVILYTFLCILFASGIILLLIVFSIVCGVPGEKEGVTGSWKGQQQIAASIEHFLQDFFQKMGTWVAHNPFTVISFGLLVIIFFSYGSTNIKMTTDPVELWASPNSRTRQEKDHFDSNFGPFYRTNQVIITTTENVQGFSLNISDVTTGINKTYNFGPVFDPDFMQDVMDLQLQIMALTGDFYNHEITLKEICSKPLAPQNDDCLIQSIMNYWQNDPAKLVSMMQPENPTKYCDFLLTCTSNPTYYGTVDDTLENCMATYGGPVLPYVALGGFLGENETISASPNYEESTALVLTFIVTNHQDKNLLGPAEAWEKAYLDFMANFTHPNMSIAHYAERSIQDEIIREGKSDIGTILISYTVMFAYVTLALGSLNFGDTSRLCVETKLWLGFCSVIVVFLSFVSAVGFCAMIGIKGTLFVLEVIPFLVLAIGVDNVFLLVQSWMRMKKYEDESVEDHVGRVVGKVAPSMLLASTAEIVCFFLGATSDMPAVYSFAIYAGFAILFNFFLQLTVLVALLTLDARRLKANRYDVLCCIEGPSSSSQAPAEDCCYSIFDDIYAPFLMNDIVRVIVFIVFTALFFTGMIFAYKVPIGLEQDVGMPKDSYVIKYFDYLSDYLSVGAPVYFVVKNYDYTTMDNQNLVCGTTGCNDDSMLTQIFVSSLSPQVSLIATGASSWLDSYFSYISDDGLGSDSFACCRLDENGEFIDSAIGFDMNAADTCLNENQFYADTQRPYPIYFMPNLPYFLIDNPHETSCPQAGHPAYGSAVNIVDADNGKTRVGADYYMAYHTILKDSADFTKGYEKAYELSNSLQEYLRANSTVPDVEVYPYSIFYVYYEQYTYMWAATAGSLAVSFISVFLVLLLLSGFDFVATSCNITIVIMIVIDILGCMTAWNIQLNAISLVNLVMATGISVEFCSHITHAFVNITEGSKKSRAKKALATTGSSVFSGITLTKFGGILVLAFANSQIITVFYFRMYMLIVLLGATHGLIFLPVLLSIFGPKINPYMKRQSTRSKLDANTINLSATFYSNGNAQNDHAKLNGQVSAKKEHEATNGIKMTMHEGKLVANMESQDNFGFE